MKISISTLSNKFEQKKAISCLYELTVENMNYLWLLFVRQIKLIKKIHVLSSSSLSAYQFIVFRFHGVNRNFQSSCHPSKVLFITGSPH